MQEKKITNEKRMKESPPRNRMARDREMSWKRLLRKGLEPKLT